MHEVEEPRAQGRRTSCTRWETSCTRKENLVHKVGNLVHKVGNLVHKVGNLVHKEGNLVHDGGNRREASGASASGFLPSARHFRRLAAIALAVRSFSCRTASCSATMSRRSGSVSRPPLCPRLAAAARREPAGAISIVGSRGWGAQQRRVSPASAGWMGAVAVPGLRAQWGQLKGLFGIPGLRAPVGAASLSPNP